MVYLPAFTIQFNQMYGQRVRQNICSRWLVEVILLMKQIQLTTWYIHIYIYGNPVKPWILSMKYWLFDRNPCKGLLLLYCWWFRNPAFTSWGKGSLYHYLQSFLHPRWLFGSSEPSIAFNLTYRMILPIVYLSSWNLMEKDLFFSWKLPTFPATPMLFQNTGQVNLSKTLFHTPPKTNMEPENQLFHKEQHLPSDPLIHQMEVTLTSPEKVTYGFKRGHDLKNLAFLDSMFKFECVLNTTVDGRNHAPPGM